MANQNPPEQYYQQSPITGFGVRLNEIEEKQRLLKDRILLIGENLISTKEGIIKKDSEIKRHLKEISIDNKSIKQLLTRIVNELNNFARKSELEILEHQMKMFEPLKFARVSEIRKIVQEEIQKSK